ncbi:MAG TPA: hypothetical protein VMI32_10155 [Candidatus Solibacter sp.]|nr:hypothetical protein [Candidatus Solibacter sp.]
MLPRPILRLLIGSFLIVVCLWIASCAAALGPGYSIEKQEIRVQFDPGTDPRILVDSDYQLRNTGNQPLASLEVRLSGRRRFRIVESRVTWDGASLPEQNNPAIPRNTSLVLPESWKVGARHTLHLFAEFQSSAGEPGLRFAADGFFLPSQGWAPELLPSEGLFPTGGVPPDKWLLQVRVPATFLVHTSGRSSKTSEHGSEITVRSIQRPDDRYPFVIAGAYKQTLLDTASGKVVVWTRGPEDAVRLQKSAGSLVEAIHTFDATFGVRSHNALPLRIVQCPVVPGCFTASASSYADLLGSQSGAVSSEVASTDTLMIDFSAGAPSLPAAAPALAASWLGYGQNPGYHEQKPPLSALPAFAAALGQEAIEGPSSRTETIRRALRMIPESATARKTESETVLRAKSFLFFFALQDRYGVEAFRRAIDHMLSARRGRGFNLNDLIAAFEQETHQNVAEFERLWMKRPGVPQEFRTRYENDSASSTTTSKEITP